MARKVKTKSIVAPSLSEFQELAERRLQKVLEVTRTHRSLLGRGGRGEVDLQVLGASRMRTLNREFRGKDRATDVLSFPAPDFYRKNRVSPRLGELLICLPVLRRQAMDVGHSEKVELDVLLVHGLLHLLGFDHEKGGVQAKTMARWEGKLLEALGRRVGLIDRQSTS